MWVITPSWSSGSWRSFLYSSVYSCHYNNSVQFSCSIMSDSWQSHKPQHARPPCPSPTPRVYPNSCPLSRWCHPTISSSVVPFSFHPQSFPASRSFPMSQLFASGGQSIGASASTLVLPIYIQDWSPLGWPGWISLQSKGLSRVFSNTTVQKHQFFYFVDKKRQLQGRILWTEYSEKIHLQATHITLYLLYMRAVTGTR